MTFFLIKRFKSLNKYLLIFLSVSFALMQYNISQSSNIMWLDGVYILPLMILGVYKIVKKENPCLLILSTGLVILFNWYIGCVNCLFTVIWLVLEYLISVSDKNISIKNFFVDASKIFFRYAASMTVGIMISAVLFLPVISVLRDGRGTIDWDCFNNSFNGNILNVIQGLVLGSENQIGKVSLFCGSLVHLGCIACFFSKIIKYREKMILGGALVISIMIFYWQPLYFIFSLLKKVGSFAYRCSHLTIFLLVFIAAYFYSKINLEEIKEKILIKSAFTFSVLLLLFCSIESFMNLKNVYFTCTSALIIACLCTTFFSWMLSKSKQLRIIITLMFSLAVGTEMMFNTKLLMQNHSTNESLSYSDYFEKQSAQINMIKSKDKETYRISQTKTYNMGKNNLTANFNEPLAYNYMSINNYDSMGEKVQIDFLDKLGYRELDFNMNVVTTSILGIDSLLGVKYILSNYPINGLEPSNIISNNDKEVYVNPYCLPFAVKYKKQNFNYKQKSFYEFHNELYSNLLGEEVCLYKKIDFTKIESEKNISYNLKVPNEKIAVYGNLSMEKDTPTVLHIDGMEDLGYSQWLSSSVFYVPTSRDKDNVSVVMEFEEKPTMGSEEFVALDLNELARITDLLKKRDNGSLQIKGSSIKIEIDSEKNDSLFLSIPYNKGWQIKINGEIVSAEKFANCLFSIPLKEGNNVITMHYSIPNLKIGFIITILGTIITILTFIKTKKGK